MAGRRANGEGAIIYDKRRKKPYRVRVTVGWELNKETGKTQQLTDDLGSFKTKGEASRALAEYQKRPFDLKDKNITFSQLYERWYDVFVPKHESSEYRIKSAYKYCSDLYDMKIREITIVDMKNTINDGTTIQVNGKNKGQEKHASPATKESIKYLFNHLLQYATELRLIERNYAKDFVLDNDVYKEKEQNHKEKIPFSEEEIDKLWRSIEFVPFADMVAYACYSGWRPSEVVKIEIKNVDLDNGFIKGGIKSTAGKNRVVPIHPLIKDIVQRRYDEAVEIGSEYLFNDPTKKKGIGLSYDQYLSRFNTIKETLKLREEVTPHYTRHTFITKAKSRQVKMDEYILKLIVGHKIGDMTEHVYTHRELEALKEEMELIKE